MAEVEERISRISQHKGIVGLIIVDDNGKILRTTIRNDSKDINPL